MALTVTITDKSVFGNKKIRWGTVTLSSDYVGGESYTVSQFALSRMTRLKVDPSSGYVFSVDAANLAVKAYYGDYSESTDGALVEVADNTNLSTLSANFEAIGIGG